jgi:hypothetical protein
VWTGRLPQKTHDPRLSEPRIVRAGVEVEADSKVWRLQVRVHQFSPRHLEYCQRANDVDSLF